MSLIQILIFWVIHMFQVKNYTIRDLNIGFANHLVQPTHFRSKEQSRSKGLNCPPPEHFTSGLRLNPGLLVPHRPLPTAPSALFQAAFENNLTSFCGCLLCSTWRDLQWGGGGGNPPLSVPELCLALRASLEPSLPLIVPAVSLSWRASNYCSFLPLALYYPGTSKILSSAKYLHNCYSSELICLNSI